MPTPPPSPTVTLSLRKMNLLRERYLQNRAGIDQETKLASEDLVQASVYVHSIVVRSDRNKLALQNSIACSSQAQAHLQNVGSHLSSTHSDIMALLLDYVPVLAPAPAPLLLPALPIASTSTLNASALSPTEELSISAQQHLERARKVRRQTRIESDEDFSEDEDEDENENVNGMTA